MSTIHVSINLDGRVFDVALTPGADGALQAEVDGQVVDLGVNRAGVGAVVRAGSHSFSVQRSGPDHVLVNGRDLAYELESVRGVAGIGGSGGAGSGTIRAPMNGKVEALLVAEGDTVEAGTVLFVLEAMKMHNEVKSPVAGVVKIVHAAPGDVVDPTKIVLEVEAGA